MKLNYYSQEIFIPQVDEKDNVIGPVERWKAHREGILHRGLTVGLVFKNQYICQHRKHPVFNGFIDLTASTHPLFKNLVVQSIEDASYQTLKREWNIKKEDVFDLKILGKVLYRSHFENYIEHEICYFLSGKINTLPAVDYKYAYGFSLMSKKDLCSQSNVSSKIIAPWVKKAFVEKLF